MPSKQRKQPLSSNLHRVLRSRELKNQTDSINSKSKITKTIKKSQQSNENPDLYLPLKSKERKDFPKNIQIVKCPFCPIKLRFSSLRKHLERFHHDNQLPKQVLISDASNSNSRSTLLLRSEKANTHICDICFKNFSSSKHLNMHKNSIKYQYGFCDQSDYIIHKIKFEISKLPSNIPVSEIKEKVENLKALFCSKIKKRKKKVSGQNEIDSFIDIRNSKRFLQENDSKTMMKNQIRKSIIPKSHNNSDDCDKPIRLSIDSLRNSLVPYSSNNSSFSSETLHKAVNFHSLTQSADWIECPICGIFAQKNNLLNHILKIHPTKESFSSTRDKKALCSFCESIFSFSALTRHILIKHTTPESWKHLCSICKKRFPIDKYLQSHMKTHTNENHANSAQYLYDRRRQPFFDKNYFGFQAQVERSSPMAIQSASTKQLSKGDVSLLSTEGAQKWENAPVSHHSNELTLLNGYRSSNYICTACKETPSFLNSVDLINHLRSFHAIQPSNVSANFSTQTSSFTNESSSINLRTMNNVKSNEWKDISPFGETTNSSDSTWLSEEPQLDTLPFFDSLYDSQSTSLNANSFMYDWPNEENFNLYNTIC